MKLLIKTGRFLYGLGIAAVGIHQLIIKDFRPEILPPFPAWAHQNIIFPIVAGLALLFAGIVISGLFKIKGLSTKNVCLYLGGGLLILLVTCQLPYILVFSPNKFSRLDVWFGAGEELTYSGGAFILAGSFAADDFIGNKNNLVTSLLEKFIPAGGVFYSVLMILFGCSHFVFAAFVATMVPKWMPFTALFWTYFVGVALVGASIAIIFKIWVRTVALLFAFMLFLFFLFFHIPDAVANPSQGGGNEIVRGIVALLFCGVALVIAATNGNKNTTTDVIAD